MRLFYYYITHEWQFNKLFENVKCVESCGHSQNLELIGQVSISKKFNLVRYFNTKLCDLIAGSMSNADSWSNVYISLFQFGSSNGKEKIGSGVKQTYVYPNTLNRVVCSLLLSHVAEYDDPTGPTVNQSFERLAFL